MEELKPRPFCRCYVILMKTCDDMDWERWIVAGFHEEGCVLGMNDIGGYDEESLVNAWNSRAE